MVFLLIWILLACPAVAQDAKEIEAGRELFAGACSACHGPNGEGGVGPSLSDGRRLRRLDSQELFNSIRNGVRGTDMPPFPLPDDQIRKMMAFVRSLSAPAADSGVPGDLPAGKQIFFGKGGCSNCHMIRGQGGFLGPDLTDIGARRSVKQLREGLLDPNARIAEGFRGVSVKARDGREIRGVARNFNNYSVQVLDAGGRLHLLSKEDIQHLDFSGKSPMPDDYSKRLLPEEVQNVLAFVSRQTIRPRSNE
ncbi:MAG: c-type cytochrome [Bryobacteraceae bacterium]